MKLVGISKVQHSVLFAITLEKGENDDDDDKGVKILLEF